MCFLPSVFWVTLRYLFISFCLSLPIHRVWGFSYHSVWWNVPIVPPWRLNSMKCQFEINCEGKKKKSDSKSSPSWRGGAVWAVVARETEGGNREKLYGEGGWGEDKKRAVWEGGFSDVFWCVLGKGQESVVKNLGLSCEIFFILQAKQPSVAHFLLRAGGWTISTL